MIDFDNCHRTYLVGHSDGGAWRYTPANLNDPRKGMFLSSHQVFSNNAMQIALSLYNSVDGAGNCVGVSHCLYLLFSRKQEGKYLLSGDTSRLNFHLDIGIAGELYDLALGHSDTFFYRVVRSGKAPKSITGKAVYRDGRRVVALRADTAREGRAHSIEVDMDRSATIALGAHCIGYGRLLYPSLSDAAVCSLLSTPVPYFRACAENSGVNHPSSNEKATASPCHNASHPTNSAPVSSPSAPSQTVVKLRSAVWAIGKQKWPRMELVALQAIQRLEDAAQLQELVDSGNKGDFRGWDAFLS
uniref:hypothetical protein n=1 Tax=Pseudomonas fluorescens TaxID=294 RepID=UPI001868612C|nr:hypothetical protein [Pseudomonas fluorescens]